MSRKTRKLIWSAPLVAVFAVAGALAIFAALGPGSVSADPLPGAVTNFEAEADGYHAIMLSWDAPAGDAQVTGYRIDILDDSASNRRVWNQLVTDTGSTATTYTHDGLDPNEENFYRVFPINSHGVGAVSEVKGATTKNVGKPGQVTGLTARAMGPTSIQLSWNAPDDGGSPIVGYRIAMATSQDDVPDAPDNDTGTTDDADTKTAASAIDFNRRDNAAIATHISNVLDTRDLNKDAPTATTVTLDELRANHAWYFRVYAVNKSAADADQFAETDSDTVDAKTAKAGQATAPTGIVAVPTGSVGSSNEISLYWNWPSDDKGADITSFRVEIRRDNRAWPRSDEGIAGTGAIPDINTALADINDGNAVASATLNVESATVSRDYAYETIAADLQSEKISFQVRAITAQLNDAGTESVEAKQGKASATVSAKANDNESRYVAPTLAGTDGIVTASTTHSSLTLNWEEPTPVNAKAPVGYRVDYAVGDDDTGTDTGTLKWQTAAPNINFSDVPYKHTGRKTGTQYFYRVFANPASTIGAGSVPFDGTTSAASSPGAVTGLTATMVSPGQIDLNWSAPKDMGGAPITRYHVVVAPTSTLLDTAKDTTADPKFDVPTHDHRAGNAPHATPNTNLPAPGADLRAQTSVLVIDTGNDDTEYSLKGMLGESTWHIQVYAVNAGATTASTATRVSEAGSNIVVRKTGKVTSSPAPIGLVAEDAANTNATSRTERGVVVLWNGPEAPAGSQLQSYSLEWKSGDGEFQEWKQVDATGANASTYETHDDELGDDEVRMYRVQTVITINSDQDMLTSDWVMVTYPSPGMHTHNAPVVGTINDVSLMVNTSTTVDLSATDADGDTVTYTAESSDDTVAMVSVSGSTLTITAGASPGEADITVTASDPGGLTDTATFKVMVTAAMLTAPSDVRLTDATTSPGDLTIEVTWTNGANALSHMVLLFDTSDYSLAKPAATQQDDGMATFTGLEPGSYLAVVVAYDEGGNIQLTISGVASVGGG